MAFVDFYQQSSLFNQPHHPTPPSSSLKGSTTHPAYNGDPTDDLENQGVFVDIEDFMGSVLHVPVDWRAQWGPVIHTVKRNPDFMKHYLKYRSGHWNEYAEPEESHYEPLLLMNDITVRTAFPTARSQGATPTPLLSRQFVYIVDDGSCDCILDDGSLIPQLIVEGKRPPSSHAQLSGEATSSSAPENSRKRKRDLESITERKKPRLGVTSAPGKAGREMDVEVCFATPPRRRRKQPIEVGRRLTELLSLRPHVTVCLADRNRIQFYHANHTVILVSSVIDLSLRDDKGGIDRFIAILIAFRYLSLHDRAVLEAGRNGVALRLQGNDKVEGPIEIELGSVISLCSSLVGRSTAVMYGTSPKWPNRGLVIKVSWVDDFRVSEREFMDKAVEKATKPGHEWAVNHLPRFFYVEDVKDPTYRSVQELFENAQFTNGEYAYQRREMRIVVQEPLDSIEMLTNVRDVGQVMLDAACVHRWLYDQAGILHGDLSPSNIMCRTVEGKVHGVLTDYDLSLWTALDQARPGTPKQRTGTPPFMANGLLNGDDSLHLYRHDVESFFYVMLILATHYEIQAPKGKGGGVRMRKGKHHFQRWFDMPNYDTLAAAKSSYFRTNFEIPEVAPSFKDFYGWLLELQMSFACGFLVRRPQLLPLKGGGFLKIEGQACCCGGGTSVFDEETLGGHITYSTIVEPTRHLTGELEGLIIRYNPPPSSPSKSTGTAQACA